MTQKLHENWLSVARNGLKSSKILSEGPDPVPDTAIYHTQQCAEKSLKAYLAFKQHSIEKTHDLVFLVDLCSGYDSDFKDLTDDAETLNPYSTLFRYPDLALEPEMEDVKEAVQLAEKFLKFVEKKISP